MFAAALRSELVHRARSYAAAGLLPYVESYGDQAVVCFQPTGDGAHGNFLAATYAAIQRNPEWRRRLAKVHTSARRSLPALEQGRWRKLDSCMSSDALLMNVFCYPRVLTSSGLRHMLDIESGTTPQFGFPACVPFRNGRFDRTEVDLRLGSLLMEAKLTEVDYQRSPKARLQGYRDFEDVFDVEGLPQTERHFDSSQIIRNVLAAHAGRSRLVCCWMRGGRI